MSYILDALRRADAERERGSVPDIHAQPVLPAHAAGVAPRHGSRLPWLVAGVAVGLLLPVVWVLWPDPVADASRPAAPAAQAPQRPTAPGIGPLSATAPPAPAMAPAPATAPATADTPSATLLLPEPGPGARKPPAATPAARPAAPLAAATASATAAPAASTAASAAAARLPSMAELPEELRRQLPPLNVGGSIYSEARESRMLILNGQVLHEGDQPAPGVVLEQIRLKSAVLSIRGQRFELGY